ncbi:ABC transporter permease [Svornostia abyssi]|uniref:Transport permease protein n=1 Tax=Svornostia abyssi TaxID=2898438 RepID=A0ABY5PCR5_9ACTN|nr:ABC transporter permease [Parviterribacteraceae bacterium J379]
MTSDLARRALLRTLRQPANVVPVIFFPMLLVAINSAGLDAASELPGFPADSYLDFIIAVPFIQGGLFAMLNAGTDLATDIESGFLRRLALTPVRGTSLLLGQVAGVVALSLVAAVVYLTVGFIAGVTVAAGPAGVVALLVFAVAIGLMFSSIGAFVGLRSGSPQTVQGFFPLFFVLLFLSSANLPRDLMEQDWFATVAGLNPVSYLIEGIRSLVVTGWDPAALWPAIAILVVGTLVGGAAAAHAMRTNLVRT